jgi:hypothetical protein
LPQTTIFTGSEPSPIVEIGQHAITVVVPFVTNHLLFCSAPLSSVTIESPIDFLPILAEGDPRWQLQAATKPYSPLSHRESSWSS